jgi:hypothetical protein
VPRRHPVRYRPPRRVHRQHRRRHLRPRRPGRLVLHRWCAIRSRGHTARRRRRRSPSLGLRGRRLGRPRHHRPSRGQTPPPLTENQNRGAACSAEPLPILRRQRASGGCAWDRGAVVASGGASCRLLFCHVLQVGRGRSVPRVPAGAYTKTTGLWALYWRDRNLKYHRYEPLDPSPQVQDLLDYLDDRADPIFWG